MKLFRFWFLIFQVGCEIGKQVSNYSIQYYNGGRYPLPQTMLVVLLEVIKLLVTVMRAGCQRPSFDSSSLRKSTKFLLPSVIYAVNNNLPGWPHPGSSTNLGYPLLLPHCCHLLHVQVSPQERHLPPSVLWCADYSGLYCCCQAQWYRVSIRWQPHPDDGHHLC